MRRLNKKYKSLEATIKKSFQSIFNQRTYHHFQMEESVDAMGDNAVSRQTSVLGIQKERRCFNETSVNGKNHIKLSLNINLSKRRTINFKSQTNLQRFLITFIKRNINKATFIFLLRLIKRSKLKEEDEQLRQLQILSVAALN